MAARALERARRRGEPASMLLWRYERWHARAARFLERLERRRRTDAAVRRFLALAAVKVALEGRRRFLPPYLCPDCAHDGYHHRFERRLELTSSGPRTSGAMVVEWGCTLCRCSGTWSRVGDEAPDRRVQAFLAAAFRRARLAAGLS